MLIFFTAQWCRFCHQMADEAFTHPQVVSLSEHFVCVLVDADSEPEICRKFGVTGYPTIQFVSPRRAAWPDGWQEAGAPVGNGDASGIAKRRPP